MKKMLRKIITGKLVATVILILSTVLFFTSCTRTTTNGQVINPAYGSTQNADLGDGRTRECNKLKTLLPALT